MLPHSKCGVAQLTIPTQSQYTGTGSTSRITVSLLRVSSGKLIHYQFFRVWLHMASGFEPPTYRSLGGRSTNEPQRPVNKCKYEMNGILVLIEVSRSFHFNKCEYKIKSAGYLNLTLVCDSKYKWQ